MSDCYTLRFYTHAQHRRKTAMAHVVQSLDQPSNYKDSQARVDRKTQADMLGKSTTLYARPSPLVTSEMRLTEFVPLADW